jgi:hypothetical protein
MAPDRHGPRRQPAARAGLSFTPKASTSVAKSDSDFAADGHTHFQERFYWGWISKNDPRACSM